MEYYTLVTDKGAELIAEAIKNGTKVQITYLAVGDGGGAGYRPTPDMTALKKETWRGEVSSLSINEQSPNIIDIVAIIPATVGGWTIREMGIFDEAGNMLVICNTPDTEKVITESGASGEIEVTMHVVLSNTDAVEIVIDPNVITATKKDLERHNLSKGAHQERFNEVGGSLKAHSSQNIAGESGAHGLRYFDEALQYHDGKDWINVETGGSGIAPNNVSGARVKTGNGKLTVYWSDPGDTVVDGQTLCTWKGTRLLQKVGAFPTDSKDGTLLIDNQVKDAYRESGFEISDLKNGTTYYFQLFPYSDKKAVNENPANRLTGVPQPFKVMSVHIDLSNSNPETAVTYADDAEGMPPGDAAWDAFFGHYPVLFEAGKEAGKLNLGDYGKLEDGSDADITTGEAGDVMVVFPRRGVKIKAAENRLTVSMTDDQDNSEFNYLAHTRGSERKEQFYLGAYKGFFDGFKLRSLSEKDPATEKDIDTFRKQAQAHGAGYEQSGFYQLVFRQVMYLLKYKQLNSQVAVGKGYIRELHTAAAQTGGTNKKGMDFGEASGKQQMKLFGLEDFWGNVFEWLEGVMTTDRHILTATTGFNNDGAGYTDRGKYADGDLSGYMSRPQSLAQTGFLPKEVKGSESTYFCDYVKLSDPIGFARFGGEHNDAGVFRITVHRKEEQLYGARLMFL